MAVRPESVEDWFHFVPTLLEDEGWQIARNSPAGKLLHRSCPWGGHLARISLRDIEVRDPPANTSHLFVRPEVRAWAVRTYPELNEELLEVVETLAPGHAVCRRRVARGFRGRGQLGVLLLCSLSGSTPNTNNFFFHSDSDSEMPGNVIMMVRRNYPRHGDSAHMVQCLSEHMECVTVGRPQGPNTFQLDVVMRVRSVLPVWAFGYFEPVVASARGLVQSFVNRPRIAEMRRKDMQCYAILTIQSWRRGPPLVPAAAEEVAQEDVTTIDAGQRDGLTSWVRYHPRMVGSSGFMLSDYLNLFFKRIGEQVILHQSVDGQELLPYQCAILREDWDRVGEHFQRAYALQKAAYRHSRGGRTAPSLLESLGPRFREDNSLTALQQRLRESIDAKTVVRKTFLDVEEPQSQGDSARQRHRTSSPVRHTCLIMSH
ncbi:unnamed protein product [Symbiodinium natans]|uniref:Uncharacterized protein n=1 Tax=Symbiodinium natans TaxID=878477 RepID=A0A812TGN4_9DINO|nr:unnamed protein product [Symbiodinium natans]